MSLSPLDARYRDDVAELEACFSEAAVNRGRLRVLVEWLLFLGGLAEVPEVPRVAEGQARELRGWVDGFNEASQTEVARIERTTRHDVVALIEFLREELRRRSLDELSVRVHYCCTSEDVVSVAYAVAIRRGFTVWSEAVIAVRDALAKVAAANASMPMLGRTHGQPAVGTTFGKELAVFAARLDRQLLQAQQIEFMAKFGGAVGNFNAHYVAQPEADWPALAQRFVEGFGVTYSPLTTQIEPKDWVAELCHLVTRANTIVVDLSRDMWTYALLGYVTKPPTGVGSSAMPQKVNPLRFENAEGNAGMSTALLGHLAEKLPTSRLQRDLSDSTVMRNLGVALGHSLVAVKQVAAALEELRVDADQMSADLDRHWETLAEAVQTILKKAGIHDAEKLVREAVREGEEELFRLLASHAVDETDRHMLSAMRPANYLGVAERLAISVDHRLYRSDERGV